MYVATFLVTSRMEKKSLKLPHISPPFFLCARCCRCYCGKGEEEVSGHYFLPGFTFTCFLIRRKNGQCGVSAALFSIPSLPSSRPFPFFLAPERVRHFDERERESWCRLFFLSFPQDTTRSKRREGERKEERKRNKAKWHFVLWLLRCCWSQSADCWLPAATVEWIGASERDSETGGPPTVHCLVNTVALPRYVVQCIN